MNLSGGVRTTMTKFSAEQIIDQVKILFDPRLEEKRSLTEQKLIMNTVDNQKIILLKCPTDEQKTVRFIENALFDQNLTVSCIVVLSKKLSHTAFFKSDHKVGHFKIKSRSRYDGQAIYLNNLHPEYVQYSLKISSVSMQSKNVIIYYCPLSADNILKDKFLIPNINHAFTE
jgi:hypothetical protein